jgi:trehalose-6-phosphatase
MRASPAIAELLAPLRADPAAGAVLLDIDGTLAPIVRHASDAAVPEQTRMALIELARRYRTVACVSGRSAAVARQIVSIGSIAYIGNHGSELLAPGSREAIVRRPCRHAVAAAAADPPRGQGRDRRLPLARRAGRAGRAGGRRGA